MIMNRISEKMRTLCLGNCNFLMIMCILVLLTSVIHSEKTNYQSHSINLPWGLSSIPKQLFHSRKHASISTRTEELEGSEAASTQLALNQTDANPGNDSRSLKQKMKLYNYILSSVMNVILGENDISTTYDPSSVEYYHPYSSSPGLLPMLFRILFLSWITSFWNPQDSQPFLPKPEQHYTFENLNDRYIRDNMAISKILNQPVFKSPSRKRRRFFPLRKKDHAKKMAIVLDLHALDNSASFSQQVDELCDSVTFLIRYAKMYHQQQLKQQSKKNPNPPHHNLEVIFRLESPGGGVQDYALASAQIQRLRTNNMNITVTVCVDKVAASGGYMVASQANQIIAAPFAIVGSIGVIGQVLNFHDLLSNKFGVQALEVKAGKYKAPVSMFGNVTQYEMDLWEENIQIVHKAFIDFVYGARTLEGIPQQYQDKIKGGDIFLASQAKELGLIDQVQTSDEYIWDKLKDDDTIVLKMIKYERGRSNWFLNPNSNYISAFGKNYPGLLGFMRSVGAGTTLCFCNKRGFNPAFLFQSLERRLNFSSEWIKNLFF